MNHARKPESINLLKYHYKITNLSVAGERVRGPIVKNPDVLESKPLM
jgi:hypothetical protein